MDPMCGETQRKSALFSAIDCDSRALRLNDEPRMSLDKNHILSEKRRVEIRHPPYPYYASARILFSLEIDSRGGVCIKNGNAIKVKKVVSLRFTAAHPW
jgi:hypothetical protein